MFEFVGKAAPTVPATPRDNALAAQAGYASWEEFLGDVVQLETTRRASPRLAPLRAAAGSDEHGEYSAVHGGVLVPGAFARTFLTRANREDITRGTTTVVPMDGQPKVVIPSRVDNDHTDSVSGGVRVFRRGETGAVDASRMQMAAVTLEIESLMGVSYVTRELEADSMIPVLGLLQAAFADEFAGTRNNELLNGNGVGQYLGILESDCLITVPKETGQPADTITYPNVLKMRARCWGYGAATWIANPTCFPEIAQLQVTVGIGGSPVWMPSAVEGEPDRLLGRPIIWSEYASSLGDLGDLVLANWTQYLEGFDGPAQMEESIHVRFVEHEKCFKFWLRSDGSPWWSDVFTPKNGDTLSPFVTLAARE